MFNFANTLALYSSLTSLAFAFAPGLKLELSLQRATQGIAISADGRRFLSQRYSDTFPPQAVELLADGTTVLYPDAEWNSWTPNSTVDVRTAFVNIDGARIGPDGRYWVVDGGTQDADGVVVNGSSKLVGVNLTTNTVDKLYYMDNFTGIGSSMDDVRFNGKFAYLSDTAGALVVLELESGKGRRLLANSPSAQAWFPMAYNHTFVPGIPPALTVSAGLDQIEVSPDGVYLYYQPCNGGMWRIKTKYVNAALYNETLAASLGNYSEPFAFTPSTGGTAIDALGVIYASDTDSLSIWKIMPDGTTSTLVQDDALLWTDLLWIDAEHRLWLPASQRRPGNDGLMALGPNYIFTYHINAGPSPIDHA